MTTLALTTARTIRPLGFTRLSNDPGGRRITHAAQRRRINELVEREGWPPIAEDDWFSETDVSASKPGVVRHSWQRLLGVVAEIDPRTVQPLVVGYAQDRLIRQVADLPTLANLLESKGGQLWTAMNGPVSIKKGGRVGFYVQGVVAADEAEKISARTLDGVATAAMAGKSHGPVGYGWSREYDSTGAGRPVGREVINETERDVVVDLARRVLAGDSLRQIANEMNAAGMPAPGGGRVLLRDPITREPVRTALDRWEPATVRKLLLRKSNIGIREHRVGDQVAEYPAAWPPLLDEVTYRRVVSVLTAPERRSSLSNVAKYLLSGIAVCGVCQQPVTIQRTPYAAYRCPRGHVVKSQPRTDIIVETALLELAGSKQVRRARKARRRGDGDATNIATARVTACEQKLKDLKIAFHDKGLPIDDYLSMSKRERDDMAAAKAVLDRGRDDLVHADLLDADPDEVGQVWDSIASMARRRAIVAALFTVVLLPGGRGRNGFDPSTVVVNEKLARAEGPHQTL